MDPAVREQIIGALRIAVPLVLGIGAARGWFSTEAAGQIANGIVDFVVAAIALGSIVWSWMANRESAQIKRVAQMSNVQKVVTTKSMASRLKYAKVTHQ